MARVVGLSWTVSRLCRFVGVVLLFLFPFALYHVDFLSLRLVLDTTSPYRQHQPLAAAASGSRVRACIVVLTRNSDLDLMLATISSFEMTFNARHHYPYVFLNDEPFTRLFQQRITHAILRFRKSGLEEATAASSPSSHDNASSFVQFGLVPVSQWSMPQFINQTKMNIARERMAAQDVLYGESVSYRLMCRYFSGYFFQHALLSSFDYYWRIEPGVTFYCSLAFDPFVFMATQGKKYAFVISLTEIEKTIPSLWPATVRFIQSHPQFFVPLTSDADTDTDTGADADADTDTGAGAGADTDTGARSSLFKSVVHASPSISVPLSASFDAFGEIQSISYFPSLLKKFAMKSNGDYNLCHFWSNFEIAAFDFFRSAAYMAYFNYLDALGGFFYERWGDAPIHSLAALAFLSKHEIHFMDEIGYNHPPFGHCPLGALAASHCLRPSVESREPMGKQRQQDHTTSPFQLYENENEQTGSGTRSACQPHHVFDTDSGSCLSAWLRL